MDADEERDIGSGYGDADEEEEQPEPEPPRHLPRDLPKSLDDRQNFSTYNQETEYYDAWQGEGIREQEIREQYG